MKTLSGGLEGIEEDNRQMQCVLSDVPMPSEEDLQADQNEHLFNEHFVCLLSF